MLTAPSTTAAGQSGRTDDVDPWVRCRPILHITPMPLPSIHAFRRDLFEPRPAVETARESPHRRGAYVPGRLPDRTAAVRALLEGLALASEVVAGTVKADPRVDGERHCRFSLRGRSITNFRR